MVDDSVVLHFPVAAHAERVVAGEVGALPHQEQARLRGVEESLCLIPSYLPMKPSVEVEQQAKSQSAPRTDSHEICQSKSHPFDADIQRLPIISVLFGVFEDVFIGVLKHFIILLMVK